MKPSSRILTSVLLSVPLGGIGIDLYASSLPLLAKHFNVSATLAKSTLTIFLAGLFIGMLYSGILSDVVGRKKPQFFNALIFGFSSILIPFSNSITLVLILRFLQGVSAGGLQAVCRSILSDAFPPEQLTKKSLYVTTVWGAGPILAPWAGGLLVTSYDWEACFYVLSLYGLLLAVFIAVAMPETHRSRPKFSVAELQKDIFYVVGYDGFILPVLAMGCAYAVLVSYGALGPYFVEVTLRLSPTTYGKIGLVIGCGYLMGNVALRVLLRRYVEDFLLTAAITGSVICSVTGILLQWMYPNVQPIWIISILISCFTMGFIYPIYMAKSLRLYPEKSGLASAVTVSTMLLLASIFSVIASGLNIRSTMESLIVYLVLLTCIVTVRLREMSWRSRQEQCA